MLVRDVCADQFAFDFDARIAPPVRSLPVVRFFFVDRVFSFDLVFNRGASHQSVDFLQSGADKTRNAAPATRPIARLAPHAVDERPHEHDREDDERQEGAGEKHENLGAIGHELKFVITSRVRTEPESLLLQEQSEPRGFRPLRRGT